MIKTEYSRKIDSTGRLLIPSKLRAQLSISAGDEYDFFIHEENGKKFLCIEIGNSELQKAIDIIEKNGLKISES